MKQIVFLLLMTAFFSCGKREKSYTATDDQLTIQAISVHDNSTSLTYKVRILPSQKIKEEGGKLLGEKMQYHMDSCFYLLKKNVEYYPENITAIANGMATNFEYLISFSLPIEEQKDADLIYHDKYITQKTYKLLSK